MRQFFDLQAQAVQPFFLLFINTLLLEDLIGLLLELLLLFEHALLLLFQGPRNGLFLFR